MSEKEADNQITLENPAIDVQNPYEFRTGVDIDFPKSEVTRPVFQQKITYDEEAWILRWSEPNYRDNNIEALDSYFLRGADFVESDNPLRDRKEAFISSHDGKNSSTFEDEEIESIKGALYCDFKINEVLERSQQQTVNDPSYVEFWDYNRDRVYIAEVFDDKIKIGITGYSQFEEEDLRDIPIQGNPEKMISELKEKTADMENIRE